jgi:hypothetical protein
LVVRADAEDTLTTDEQAYLHVPSHRAQLFDSNGNALPRLA